MTGYPLSQSYVALLLVISCFVFKGATAMPCSEVSDTQIPLHYCWFLRPLCLRLEIFMTLWVGSDIAVPFMAEH